MYLEIGILEPEGKPLSRLVSKVVDIIVKWNKI
jgi:hypothetical protein